MPSFHCVLHLKFFLFEFRKDILSDYIANNRSLTDLQDYETLYNYGFVASYGIGFGFPLLLLDVPDTTMNCGSKDFEKVIEEYELNQGISGLLERGMKKRNIASVVKEFDQVIYTKLNCIDKEVNIESYQAS